MSFDEWMTDAETNTGDLEMYGKKKMVGGGKMKYGHGGKATNGNKSARREYNKGGLASAMKTSKPC